MIFFSDLEMAFGVFTNQEAIPEAPLGGASGPLQAPSTYVCDRRYIARFPTMFPPPNPVFFYGTPSSETSDDGRFSRIRRFFLSFLLVWGLSLVFYLPSWALKNSPKPIWKGPPRTVFIKSKGHVTHPAPARID